MSFASAVLPALENLLNYFQKDHANALERQQWIEDKRRTALLAMSAALTKTHSYQDLQPNGD